MVSGALDKAIRGQADTRWTGPGTRPCTGRPAMRPALQPPGPGRGRVLITGWPSFLHGEATAGDVLAMEAARAALGDAGLRYDVAGARLPARRPDARGLPPGGYTHLVFTCGPVRGWQIEQLHARHPYCHRVAVGVSVIDPADPAVTGFHQGCPGRARHRRAAGPGRRRAVPAVPVAVVILAAAQPEYAARGRHTPLTASSVSGWPRRTVPGSS